MPLVVFLGDTDDSFSLMSNFFALVSKNALKAVFLCFTKIASPSDTLSRKASCSALNVFKRCRSLFS